MTRDSIITEIRKYAFLEMEAEKLLQKLQDLRMRGKMQMFGKSKRHGRVIFMIALRVSQYGAQRAYWERQAKRFTRNLKTQRHA